MVITILLLDSCSVMAQKDYRPGYLIQKNGDTVRGLLLYRDVNSSSVCTFKLNPGAAPEKFLPADIRAFRFDEGKYFVSATAPLESGDRSAFLEYLVKGKANVYYMKDGSDHYFIAREDGKLVELSETEKIFHGENGYDVVKPEQYTGRLKSVLSDCPSLFDKIEGTTLSHRSLMKLAKEYHARVCPTEECTVFERNRKLPALRVGFFGGVTFNQIKFGGKLTSRTYSGSNVTYGRQVISGYSPGFELGGRIELQNAFASFEHASLIADVVLQGFFSYDLRETGEYDHVDYQGRTYILSLTGPQPFYQRAMKSDLNIFLLKIPLRFSYTFLKSRVRPNVSVGLMNMLTLKQNKDFKLERFTDEFGKSVPGYHVGFCGSAGIRWMMGGASYLFTDLGYEFTQTTNTWPDLRFINSLFSLRIGYML